MSNEDILDHGRRLADLERKVADLYKHLGHTEPDFGGGFTFASDQPKSVAASEDPRVVELVQSGRQIDAIKLYRELTGVGLAEAKDAVERIRLG